MRSNDMKTTLISRLPCLLPPFPQPMYVNPLVAVRFHLVGKKSAKIQCRVVSHQISYQNYHDPYEGKVDFALNAVK